MFYKKVMLQVWRQASDFDDRRGRPFTWLVTLARSRAIDRLRMLGARQRLVDSAAQNSPDAVSDAVNDTLHSEQREIVTGLGRASGRTKTDFEPCLL